MKLQRLIVIVSLVLFLSLALFAGKSIVSSSFEYGQAGTVDFIQYWSSHRLLLENKDPYVPSSLLEMEKTAGFSDTKPIMMWVPPWTLLFLRPVLGFPFSEAARLWFLANLILFSLSTFILYKLLPRSLPYPLFLGAALVFAPVWNAVHYGQASMLLLLGGSLLLYGQKQKSPLILGIGLALVAVKPYIFHIPLLVLLFQSLRSRDFLIAKAGLITCLILATTFIFYPPESIIYWLNAMASSKSVSGAVSPQQFMPATLVTPLRFLISNEGGYSPSMLISSELFLLTDTFVFLYLIKRGLPQASWFLPLMFLLSYLTAPYGWFFDQSMLLPAHMLVVVSAFALPSGKGAFLVALACAVQLAAQGYAMFLAEWHHEMFWVPLCLLLLCLYTCRRDSVSGVLA